MQRNGVFRRPSAALRRWALATVLMGLMATAGCGDSGGAPWSGTYNPGSVPPECGALNQVCLARGLNGPLAVGSSLELDLDYNIGGSSGLPATLVSADPEVLSATGMTVEAMAPGASAVMFVGPDGAIMDFLHVWATDAEELRIYRYTEAGVQLGRVQDEVILLKGDEVLVFVAPYADAQQLLGNFPMERTVDGTAVALVPDVVTSLYRVVARNEGLSTVTFFGLGLSQAWEIEVLP